MTRTLVALALLSGASVVLTASAEDGATRNVAVPASAAYQDRIIEGLVPEGDDGVTEDVAYNREGWARYLRLEGRFSSGLTGRDGNAPGLAFYGFIETPNHGVLSADLSAAPGGFSHQALTLRQRGLPVDGGWRVNNEAGVIAAPTPALTRMPSRIVVPGQLIEGLSTEWLNSGRGLQLQASTGQPGRLEGSPTSWFNGLAGNTTTLGAQLDHAPWQLSARLERADGISLQDAPALPGDWFDAQSAQVTVRREQDGHRIQANLVTTRSSNVAGQRSGIWLDDQWQEGPRQHVWGLYWLEPELGWAAQPLPSDTAGAYLRSTWRTRQWSTEGGVDWLRSVSDPARTGIFAIGGVRWRHSRDLDYGAGVSVRRFEGNAWSAYADGRWTTERGSSTLRLSLAEELDNTRSHGVALDHDWQLPTSWSLATGLSVRREDGPIQDLLRLGAAASLGMPLGSNTVLRGSASAEHTSSGESLLALNLGLNWRIGPRWSLEGSVNVARGQARPVVPIDPLATPAFAPSITSNSHAFFVVLRYENRAGSLSAPLGGRPRDGGGSIRGTVFFDANRNGRQEAGEAGAANVSVYLDSRYAVRTDAQGRFEFPFVASGAHTISLPNETLPLPWVAAGDGRTPVTVRVREDLPLALGVVRQGGD